LRNCAIASSLFITLDKKFYCFFKNDLIASKIYQNIKISSIKIEICAKTSSIIFRIKIRFKQIILKTNNEIIKKHVKNTSIFTVVMLLKITGSFKDSVKVLGLTYLLRTKKLILMEIKKITAFILLKN
jgi:hypothetical protein